MMRRGFYYSLIDGKIYDEFEDKYLTNEETVETLNELRTQKIDLIGEVAQLNYYFNKLNEKGIKWADIINEENNTKTDFSNRFPKEDDKQ